MICVRHCLREVEEALVFATQEFKKISERGRVSYDSGLILVHKYEVLTDQIYRTMENIAAINSYLYPTRDAPPWSFRKQMEKVREGEFSFSDSYDSIIKGDMKWYEEVLRIRRNSAHFIIGIGVCLDDAEGELIMGYHNYEVSEREGKHSSTGEILNRIQESAGELFSGFETCVEAIGNAWLEEVDPTSKSLIPYDLPDRTEFRELSLKEYRVGKKGRLVATNYL